MFASVARAAALVPLIALLLLAAVPDTAASSQEEEERGMWIEREDGRFLNLLVDDNHFELYFFDEKKEPVEPDAVRAIIHYTPANVRTRETVLLTRVEDPEKGVFYTSPRFIRPPYNFRASLVLVLDEAGTRMEMPPLNTFRQPDAVDGDPYLPPAAP